MKDGLNEIQSVELTIIMDQEYVSTNCDTDESNEDNTIEFSSSVTFQSGTLKDSASGFPGYWSNYIL